MYAAWSAGLVTLQDKFDQGPTSAHTASHVTQANWRPAEEVDNHDQGRSGQLVFGYARWRKDWMKVSSEIQHDRRAWGVSVRDVVNSIGECRHKTTE